MSDLNEAMQAPEPPAGTPTAEEKQWALIAHLSAFIGLIIPFGSIIAPLVVWLIKKDQLAFVNDQAKEALNFNITIGIIGIGLILLTIITFGIGALLAVPVGILVGIAWIVLIIMAAIKANEGEAYRYPFILRLVK